MRSSRIHDAAFDLSLDVMKIFDLMIEEEERVRVWAVVYQTIKEGIESYEAMAERRTARLSPGKN